MGKILRIVSFVAGIITLAFYAYLYTTESNVPGKTWVQMFLSSKDWLEFTFLFVASISTAPILIVTAIIGDKKK